MRRAIARRKRKLRPLREAHRELAPQCHQLPTPQHRCCLVRLSFSTLRPLICTQSKRTCGRSAGTSTNISHFTLGTKISNLRKQGGWNTLATQDAQSGGRALKASLGGSERERLRLEEEAEAVDAGLLDALLQQELQHLKILIPMTKKHAIPLTKA